MMGSIDAWGWMKVCITMILIIALWELNRYRVEQKKEEYISTGEKELGFEK